MPLFQLNLFILLTFTSYAITNSNTVNEILPSIPYNNCFQDYVLSGVALGTLLVAGCQCVNVNACALCFRDKFT